MVVTQSLSLMPLSLSCSGPPPGGASPSRPHEAHVSRLLLSASFQSALLPAEEQVITVPMDNGWSRAIDVGKLPEGDGRPVVVDMDPTADPTLFWAGKRNKREVPVLPLQRNEIVSESRIAQIIERARKAAEENDGRARQGHLFADLEKKLRESDRSKRVEFYSHEEDWKNKLICGDSLHVMESLLHYEGLRRWACNAAIAMVESIVQAAPAGDFEDRLNEFGYAFRLPDSQTAIATLVGGPLRRTRRRRPSSVRAHRRP
jgi:hypothetical protein